MQLINNGDLGSGYSHKPWSTTAAILDVSLPPYSVTNIRSDKTTK